MTLLKYPCSQSFYPLIFDNVDGIFKKKNIEWFWLHFSWCVRHTWTLHLFFEFMWVMMNYTGLSTSRCLSNAFYISHFLMIYVTIQRSVIDWWFFFWVVNKDVRFVLLQIRYTHLNINKHFFAQNLSMENVGYAWTKLSANFGAEHY